MKRCPYCKHMTLRKNGLPEGRQRYKCTNCERNMLEGAKLDFTIRPKKEKTKKANNKPTHPCAQCGKETTNQKFCSRSCNTTYKNLNNPEIYEKRKKQRFCRHCGAEVTGRKVTCEECNMNNIDWDERRICDIKRKAKYQVHSHIRERARRRYYNSDRPQYCLNCGYKKHIHICHIKAIADYPVDTPVSEVNDLKNLAGLCPNCHWELDHGELTADEIRQKLAEVDAL